MLQENNPFNPDIELSANSNFRILVSVIGYQSQGESIIIRCYDTAKDISLHCIVIDSYELGNRNITVELLKDDFNIKHIDVLCWTHPHLDHSKGLEELIETFCDNNTKFILPDYLYNKPSDLTIALNDEEKACVEKIFKHNESTKLSTSSIKVPSFGHVLIQHAQFSAIGEAPLSLNIYAITPIDSILEYYHWKDEHDIDPNELSVSLLVDINGYKLLFGADSINTHIDGTSPNLLEGCRFVKIPHHGSDTSDHLIDRIGNLDTACTTVYHIKKDLPLKSIIERYQKEKKADVYCTGSYEKCDEMYGVINYSIELSKYSYDVELINSACLLDK